MHCCNYHWFGGDSNQFCDNEDDQFCDNEDDQDILFPKFVKIMTQKEWIKEQVSHIASGDATTKAIHEALLVGIRKGMEMSAQFILDRHPSRSEVASSIKTNLIPTVER